MNVRLARTLANSAFDALTGIPPDGRWSAFRVCGGAGLLAGVCGALVLARGRGLSWAVVLAMTAAALGSFAALAVLRSRLTRTVRLVSLPDQLAGFAGAAGLLALLGQPVLAYLDLAAIGVGGFVAGGRVGCLLVGCCHGRPGTWGPRYGPAHVEAGLPAEYAGVRLLPVPLFEAVALTGVTLAGAALAVRSAPGAGLAGYALALLFLRFWLEYLRGDERPAVLGVSGPQVIAVAGTAGLAGVLAVRGDALAGPAAGALLIMLGTLAVPRMRRLGAGLAGPRHIREVLGVVHAAERAGGGLVTATTELGIRMSAQHGADDQRHYAFSRSEPAGELTRPEAEVLGRLTWLAAPAGTALLVDRTSGAARIYHLAIRTGGHR